jgi:steroid 5-alpha reductase family enzyme
MTGAIWTLLGSNLLVLVATATLVAVPSFRSKDPSYVDGLWGLGFVLVALSSLVQSGGDSARRAVLVVLTAVWGIRLSVYLLRRWRRQGPDARYVSMLGSDPTPLRLLAKVFWTQAVLVVVVALPVQLGQVYDDPFTVLNVVGAAIAVFGIAFESVADLQLKRFKADPQNHGTVLDTGLWGCSRHPNYFGEACTWWGLFGVTVSNGATALAVVGPVVITVFLLRFSGVGPLERQLKDSKPAYVDYIASTSGFLPLPRRHAAQVIRRS